jgi:hypothetical protein
MASVSTNPEMLSMHPFLAGSVRWTEKGRGKLRDGGFSSIYIFL